MSPQQPDKSNTNSDEKELLSLRQTAKKLTDMGQRALHSIGQPEAKDETVAGTPLTLEEAIVKYNEAVIFGADEAAIKGLAEQIDAIGAERKKKPLRVPEAVNNFTKAIEADVDSDVLVQYAAVVDNAMFLMNQKLTKGSEKDARTDTTRSADKPRTPKEAFKKGYNDGRRQARRVHDTKKSGGKPRTNSRTTQRQSPQQPKQGTGK